MILTNEQRIKWFWNRVEKTDYCWIYNGANTKGYGHFYHHKKHHYSHHFSYKLTNNLDWNKRLFICHTCDNPSCVNPDHFFEGTQKINIQDMIQKGRGGGHLKKGLLPSWSYLTLEQANLLKKEAVQFILPSGRLKKGTAQILMNKYKITYQVLNNILKGKTYVKQNINFL